MRFQDTMRSGADSRSLSWLRCGTIRVVGFQNTMRFCGTNGVVGFQNTVRFCGANEVVGFQNRVGNGGGLKRLLKKSQIRTQWRIQRSRG